ncbi:MAG: diaminopimelate epimerase, partial [Clostridiales bacterium]|nr:diaminopimelate epimerase [Clostridiales bacterium]
SCGNDYIYIDCFHQQVDSPEALSVELSDRHFGIGGDGIVLIGPSNVADASMHTYNRDGSEGLMGGNAIRCVGKYLHDVRRINKLHLTIETASGLKQLRLITKNGQVIQVEVNMGKAELEPEKIPVLLDGSRVVDREVELCGCTQRITCVSTGNPHCVLFCSDVDGLDIDAVGPKIEYDPLFPERVNAEFVQPVNDRTLKMRVWERGSGETWACGTGACAAVVAAVENGLCPMGETVRVMLRGGDLFIRYLADGAVFLMGDAQKIYEGDIEI